MSGKEPLGMSNKIQIMMTLHFQHHKIYKKTFLSLMYEEL